MAEDGQDAHHTDASHSAPLGPGVCLDRRDALARISAGIAASTGAAVALGSLLTASGCASTPERASRIGDPIPGDPRVSPVSPRSTGASPRALTDAAARPVIAQPPTGVIPRSRWARWGPDIRLADRMGSISMITVHHDGMSAFTSRREADAARRLESIRSAHRGQRWADIGYHYAIDPAGRVWQGRPITLQGAHVKHNNPSNLGILVMGNYERQNPSPDTLATLDGNRAARNDGGGVPPSQHNTGDESNVN
ncbi:MAG: peptidoglycan recognition family protein, partial [Planctomycetota bacterium]